MSRYEFEADGNQVVVGWDPPMRTFFGQLHSDEDILVWVGAAYDELPTVQDLEDNMRGWYQDEVGVELPDGLREKLLEDQTGDVSVQTEHQKLVERIIRGLENES